MTSNPRDISGQSNTETDREQSDPGGGTRPTPTVLYVARCLSLNNRSFCDNGVPHWPTTSFVNCSFASGDNSSFQLLDWKWFVILVKLFVSCLWKGRKVQIKHFVARTSQKIEQKDKTFLQIPAVTKEEQEPPNFGWKLHRRLALFRKTNKYCREIRQKRTI